MPWHTYAVACDNPDCTEHEVFTKETFHIGDLVTCECGHPGLVVPPVVPAIGILVEHHDPQTGETFKSNAHYKDYLKYGRPIKNASGEVTGFKPIREYSSAELDQHRDRVVSRMEKTAAKNGMTLEQAAAKRRADVMEKRTKEIEQGLKPTVGIPKEFRL